MKITVPSSRPPILRAGLALALATGALTGSMTLLSPPPQANAAVNAATLATPSAPSLVGTDARSITVGWAGVDGATGYKVNFRPAGQDNWWGSDWLSADTRSFTLSPTDAGTRWEFSITVHDDTWADTPTGPATTVTAGEAGTDPAPQPAPAPGSGSGDINMIGSGSGQTPSSGPFAVARNAWCNPQPSDSSVDAGISAPHQDGSVDARFTWSYPSGTGRECGGALPYVWSYPEVIYGVGGGKQGKSAPDAKFPARLDRVQSLRTSASGVEVTGAKGLANVSYDVWLGKPGTDAQHMPLFDGQMAAHTEIMVPTNPINGYGIPNAAKNGNADGLPRAGRSGVKAGTNQEHWVERVTIGGVEYDVFVDPNHSGWQLINLLRVNWPSGTSHNIDWKPIFNYLVGKGYITNDLQLMGVEFGVEPSGGENNDPTPESPVSDDQSGANGSAGDLTVRGYTVDAQVTP